MSAETLLSTFFPWLTAFFLVIFAIANIALLVRLVRSLWKAPKLVVFMGILLLIGGVYLRFFLVPNQHRIFYDEDRYLGYSVSFARLNKAVSLELATPHESIIGKPDQAVRVTVPVLHGLILKTFGYDEANLFNTSRVISLLFALYLAVFSFQLFRSYIGSLIVLAGILLLPIQVYWSASMALDPYFVFFTVTTFVCLIEYLKRPSVFTSITAATSIFLLLCVRIEAFILLPIFGFYFYQDRRNADKPIVQRADRLFFGVLIPLVLARGGASISVLGQKWCCADSLPLEAFSIKYITRNALPNILYFFTSAELPYVITLPALWLGLRSRTYQHRVLMFWIVSFFALYSFYYAGLFVTPEFSGSYARYFLILIPPLLLLFGDAVASHLIPCAKRAKKNILIALTLVVLGSGQLTYTFWQYKDLVVFIPVIFNPVDQGPIYVHAYLEHVLLPQLPKDSVVIHPITSVPFLHGHTTLYYQFFFENDTALKFIDRQLQQGKRVFTMNALDCQGLPYKCAKINELFVAKYSKLNKPESSRIFQIYEIFRKK